MIAPGFVPRNEGGGHASPNTPAGGPGLLLWAGILAGTQRVWSALGAPGPGGQGATPSAVGTPWACHPPEVACAAWMPFQTSSGRRAMSALGASRPRPGTAVSMGPEELLRHVAVPARGPVCCLCARAFRLLCMCLGVPSVSVTGRVMQGQHVTAWRVPSPSILFCMGEGSAVPWHRRVPCGRLPYLSTRHVHASSDGSSLPPTQDRRFFLRSCSRLQGAPYCSEGQTFHN